MNDPNNQRNPMNTGTPDPHEQLTPAGQALEDAAILRQCADRTRAVAIRSGSRYHVEKLLNAIDDLQRVAHDLDGKAPR